MAHRLSRVTAPGDAVAAVPYRAVVGNADSVCLRGLPNATAGLNALSSAARAGAPRYLDVRGTAAYLALTRKALYHRVSRRSIPFIKVGRLLRFDRQALDRWIRKGAVDNGGGPVARCASVQTSRAIAA
jgi:excisionase family DNA binding protein